MLLPDCVAQMALEKFQYLAALENFIKEDESTVMAAAILQGETSQYRVVALATGTKCLGVSQLSG